jgi:hypothetical protein
MTLVWHLTCTLERRRGAAAPCRRPHVTRIGHRCEARRSPRYPQAGDSNEIPTVPIPLGAIDAPAERTAIGHSGATTPRRERGPPRGRLMLRPLRSVGGAERTRSVHSDDLINPPDGRWRPGDQSGPRGRDFRRDQARRPRRRRLFRQQTQRARYPLIRSQLPTVSWALPSATQWQRTRCRCAFLSHSRSVGVGGSDGSQAVPV